jgi:DNA-binding NarL/FixJ family response regulator
MVQALWGGEVKKSGSLELSEVTYPYPVSVQTGKIQAGSKIRVMVVDDHSVVRQALCTMLHSQYGFEIAGEATNGEEAVQRARELQPDVILMDISMPKMNGLEATKVIHRESPHTRIIGLSMYDDAEMEKNMVNAGAVAFISKSGHTEELLTAIRGSACEKLPR